MQLLLLSFKHRSFLIKPKYDFKSKPYYCLIQDGLYACQDDLYAWQQGSKNCILQFKKCFKILCC